MMKSWKKLAHTTSLAAVFLFTTASRPEQPPSNDVPTAAEEQARAALAKIFPGRVVFDSNRGKGFGIHLAELAANTVVPLHDTDLHEMYPHVSPDGTSIVFAQALTEKKRSPSDIWIMSSDGSNARKIASDGTFPTFSNDGKHVFFERQRKRVMRLDLASTKEEEVFPKDRAEWADRSVVKPQVSPDGKYVAFISEKPRRWSSWFVELSTGGSTYVGPGCEPTWFPDSSRVAWVSGRDGAGQRTKERAGIASYEMSSRQVSMLQDADAPRGHEYYPTVTKDRRFLLYSAARPKEHDPTTANYQLFIKDLQSDRVTRITFDRFTNRWPRLLPNKG